LVIEEEKHRTRREIEEEKHRTRREIEEEKHRTRREIEEDRTPLWVKIFGGAILSICFLCVITLTGYIVNSINNIQTQVNFFNVEMVTKKEFTDYQKSIFYSIKSDADNISSLKERLNIIDSLTKDRQLWIEKLETKIAEQNKDIQLLRERIASIEGKSSNVVNENKKD